MNTLQRPLFRQVGGPAEMMPQASPVEMVEAVEQTTASNMEAMGQDYVQGMMQGLDGAQDFKQVIDSLRGNAMPLEERYLELSEYVGEDDAEKTPESVLAMVQPVIMMTEEGNVDSGIGQLMESLAGDVDMMTEAGQPTNMGQGVGGLIAANQEAPVQQFANGGQVQHFYQAGPVNQMPGPVNLFDQRDLMSQLLQPATKESLIAGRDLRLPMYRDALGIAGQKDMTKSQVMFDIAQAGLNFAGGVDPRTGQSMTKRSMGSQLAAAASGLPQQIGERVAAGRQLEQQANIAALQAAEAEQKNIRADYAAQLGSQIRGASAESITDKTTESAENIAYMDLTSREKIAFENNAASLERLGISTLSSENIAARRETGANFRNSANITSAQKITTDNNLNAVSINTDSIEGAQTRQNSINENQLAREALSGKNTLEAIGARGQIDLKLSQENHLNRIDQIKAGYTGEGGLATLRSELQGALNQNLYDHQTSLAEEKNELARFLSKEEMELAGKALDLQAKKFKLMEQGQLSTNLSWLESVGNFVAPGQPFSSDARKQAEAIAAIDLEQNKLLLGMNQYGANVTGPLNNLLAINQQRLNQQKINILRSDQLYGMYLEQSLPEKPAEFNSNQMNALLADADAIRSYATGGAMPRFELAISQKFKDSYDPETGMKITAEMPAGLKSAIAIRAAQGLAVPLGQYLTGPQIQRIRAGTFANGGPVQSFANGQGVNAIDPQRGMYEPITGGYLPRNPGQGEPITFDQPIISSIDRGIDITKATGADAKVKGIASDIFSAVTALGPGKERSLAPETEEAVRSLDSFTQIALTRALGSLAGRENKELQERLAKLQVPAAEFFYNDTKALAQFRASSRVMDFAIREQEALMQGPGLTRTERNKANKDLGSLKSIKGEYDYLVTAYSNKLEGDTENVSSQLDQFFN
tara:strand:+ start:1162 stop:3957 length:2796 start_codon:yes stop_codon:yes gene_type:complete